MANYNDGLGNYFLGNVTLSSGYPVSDTDKNILSTDLTAILTNSGARFRDIPTNTEFSNNSCNILFGANEDTIDDRIALVTGLLTGGSGAVNDNRIYLFNNLGSTLSTRINTSAGTTTLTNQIYLHRSLPSGVLTTGNPAWNSLTTYYWTGVSDGNSIALASFVLNTNPLNYNGYRIESRFLYAGTLLSPDGSLDTQSKKYITIVATNFMSGGSGEGQFQFYRQGRGHLQSETFNGSSGIINFSCANSNVPTNQWTMPFKPLDTGTPNGTARNLLIGRGSFPLIYPLTISGTGGREKWLPVCHFNLAENSAYTILMRN